MGSLSVCVGLFPKSSPLPNVLLLLFSTFIPFHINGALTLISLFYFFFSPSFSPQRQWVHVWISECICEHSCMLVCESVSVCGSPHTNPPENRKKCGEKSVWTKIINIQWWRSDLFLSFCCMSFLWVKPAVVWRDTTPSGTDNMRDNDHTSARTSAILQSLHPSIFQFFHLTKKKKHISSLLRKRLLLTFNPSNLLSSQMGQSQWWYSWTIFQTQTHSVRDCMGLLLHKTTIQCSFVGLFYWRNKVYWASEWLKMSEE